MSAEHFTDFVAVAMTLSKAIQCLASKAFMKGVLQVITTFLAGFISWGTVKILGIPGFPWNGLVLGGLLAKLLRRLDASDHGEDKLCDCGEHTLSELCPYDTRFWEPASDREQDDGEITSEEDMQRILQDELMHMAQNFGPPCCSSRNH